MSNSGSMSLISALLALKASRSPEQKTAQSSHNQIERPKDVLSKNKIYKKKPRYSLSSSHAKCSQDTNSHLLKQFATLNILTENDHQRVIRKNHHKSSFLLLLQNERYQQKLRNKRNPEEAQKDNLQINSSIEVAQSKYAIRQNKRQNRKKSYFRQNLMAEANIPLQNVYIQQSTVLSCLDHDRKQVFSQPDVKFKIQQRLFKRIIGRKAIIPEKIQGGPKQFWNELVKEQKKLISHLDPKFPMTTTRSLLAHFHATVDVAKVSKANSPPPSRPFTSAYSMRKSKNKIHVKI